MPNFPSPVKKLKAYDVVVVIFYLFLTFLNIVFSNKIELWKTFITFNILIITTVFILAYAAETYRIKILRILHYLYLIPLVLITFKEVYYLIRPLRPNDYDYLLIEIDRLIFGGDPTIFLYKISHPILTEILQIVYGLFYFLPIILAIALLIKRRLLETDFALFVVIYGFFLSYLGYFALPAIGPRFTLHDFQNENIELPGILITDFLRNITNTVESIPPGTPNPEQLVQRDVFPSGHTMITLVVIFLSVKLKSRSRFFIIPTGILLIFATVYLRYHYVVDLIGGLVFMIFCVFTSPYLFNWWNKNTGRSAIKITFWKND
ncbi:MAG: phosphatase PAP2 family protein [Ignavibacteriaceae bacterium]|nr:phosphatase PAP2 family protein [Ignavibacteriaceae bacterium]